MHTLRIELLQQMPVFGGLAEPALAVLLAGARELPLRCGEFVVREGEPAQAMYVLESGRVRVTRQWAGRELVLTELGAGDCFGEMALLDLYPRSASVRALEDGLAIELTPAQLLQLYEHDLEAFAMVQMNLAREMSRRLRATDDLLFRARMGDDVDDAGAGLGAL